MFAKKDNNRTSHELGLWPAEGSNGLEGFVVRTLHILCNYIVCGDYYSSLHILESKTDQKPFVRGPEWPFGWTGNRFSISLDGD